VTGSVLGTTLNLTTYTQVAQEVIQIARSGKVAALAAANTHLIAEAVDHPEFAAVLAGFDWVVPDGMPLVWALQLDGHDIDDRVYGPYLMQHLLTHSPKSLRHYFLGGTEECLHRLQQAARKLNPEITIAGALSPPFGRWDDATETAIIQAINAAQADLIWVALGGVKQETWIARNRHRFQRGVFLAVGDAFALVAGMRSFAPGWMQRCGLTWMFRLIQEPRRLLTRYLEKNTRFIIAFLADRLRRVYDA